jgi:serine phosphatase RsbU (regulator of sigma subunit)
MASHSSQSGLGERLSGHLESFQENFRTLSGAATLKDMAGRFSDILRRNYPSSTVSLLHRSDGAKEWQLLAGSGAPPPPGFPELPATQTTALSAPDPSAADIRAVQRLVDRSCVGIHVSRPQPGPGYGEADTVGVHLLAHLFDNAYQAMLSRKQEKNLIFSLNHRVLQLNSLIDTGIEVAKFDENVSPDHLALERAASLTNASRGTLIVTDSAGNAHSHIFPEGATPHEAHDPKHTIVSTFTYAGNTYAFQLFDKETRSGHVPFDETDQLLLDALVRQVHASLENRYLHAQALEKQKIEQDIAVAASIQQRILPTSLPKIEGYDIAGINIPSKWVGGDYYDCIPLPDGRYALVIADVAGKGIPAGLLVSSFHAYLSAYLEEGLPILDLVGRLNRVICRASTDDKFITAFIGILDHRTGSLETVNAGHGNGYLLRADGTFVELSQGGVPFGMLDMDFPYQSETTPIGSGDRLLLYTDGITEASTVSGELYDSAVPLKDFFLKHRPEKADTFIQDLIADIRRFTGDAPQSDDITAMILLRR